MLKGEASENAIITGSPGFAQMSQKSRKAGSLGLQSEIFRRQQENKQGIVLRVSKEERERRLVKRAQHKKMWMDGKGTSLALGSETYQGVLLFA